MAVSPLTVTLLRDSFPTPPPLKNKKNSTLGMVPACQVASVVSDSATLWSVALQAPLSVGFSRQDYWSGFPCSPSGDLPDLGIKPESLMSPTLQADSLPLGPSGKPNWIQ